MRFDLQSHSTCSDGALEPQEVVQRAAAAGVELLALSDHDTLEGVAAAREEASRVGIGLVNAVEISAIHEGGRDLHVLGYNVELGSERLNHVLGLARGDRAQRAERMAAALRELGYELDESALAERRESGRAIGRPHLAAAVVHHPGNEQRLRDEGIAEPSSFLEAYLIPGRPAFSERAAPTVAGAIELIHAAGGQAIWAHPFWDYEDEQTVLAAIDEFVADGLDGVEVFYVTHTQEQTRLLHRRVRELDLLTTGSSDFHGPAHARFNRFLAHETYGLDVALGPIADNL
jgi:predicted metal-dependent phosphoesterase TrpH